MSSSKYSVTKIATQVNVDRLVKGDPSVIQVNFCGILETTYIQQRYPVWVSRQLDNGTYEDFYIPSKAKETI